MGFAENKSSKRRGLGKVVLTHIEADEAKH
jgi:hypothetical protein